MKLPNVMYIFLQKADPIERSGELVNISKLLVRKWYLPQNRLIILLASPTKICSWLSDDNKWQQPFPESLKRAERGRVNSGLLILVI